MKIKRTIEFEVPDTEVGRDLMQGQLRYSCPDGEYTLFRGVLSMKVTTEDSLVASANQLTIGEKWAGPKPLPYSAPIQLQKEQNVHTQTKQS